MSYSYKTFFQNLYRMQGQSYAFCARSVQEAEAWQERFRTALSQRLGLELLEEAALRLGGARENSAQEGGAQQSSAQQSSAQESGAWENSERKSGGTALVYEVQEEGYRRRKYVTETLPGVYMPFYMLIPDGVDAERPECAMLTVPAHGANKNTVCGVSETPEEREKIEAAPAECYGREFARKGYVVFCPDPPGYGERTEPIPSEDRCFAPDRTKSSLESSCKDLAQTAEALGLSLTALEIWDLMRLTDFACGCGEVKRINGVSQIGCAGFSGGGQYTMWLAALDERICAAVVSGYVHGYYDSILECHLCPCNYAPDLWRLGDISDICSLIAPRPLFVENGTQDVENGPCGIVGPRKQVERIREAYALFGAQEKLCHSTPDGPHRWYGGCYEFVEQNLRNGSAR